MKKFIYLLIISFLVGCSSDGANDTTTGNGDGQGGSLARFALSGDYLYTVDEQSLNVFDITTVEEPTYKGNTYIGFDIETLFSFEDRLYVGSNLGMYIYDISTPKTPLLLSEVSHIRSCDPVISSGDITYVTLHSNTTCAGDVNQLEIYNTENELNPELLTTVEMISPVGMALYHNYLLVADKYAIKIVDVTEPQYPDLVDIIGIGAFDLIIKENHLYAISESRIWQYQLNPDDITNYTEISQLQF